MTDPAPPDRWPEIDAAFATALELPREKRAAYLKGLRRDPELRRAVARLLEVSERSDSFLDTPGRGVSGSLLADFLAEDRERSRPVRGRRVGRYRLIRELGRGGAGTVFLAERADGSFEQHVAIKVLRRGLDTDDIVRRFLAERQILASLAHPNIAHVFDGGATDDGLPYFVMEYVQGRPITEYADAHRLTVEQRLRLFSRVARAVRHAHRNLVVHRDLKPSNILVAEDGSPKLLDFGIAKVLNPSPESRDTPRTRTGAALMTPEYASPEQVRGEAVTPATDVYQLGVLLYKLLTGRRPHPLRATRPEELRHAVLQQTPERPSAAVLRGAERIDGAAESTGAGGWTRGRADPVPVDVRRRSRRLHGDLDAIILRALRKEPERRYGSADALLDELRRHLAGLPVRTRPDSWRRRTWRWAGRNRGALRAAALGGLAVLVTVAIMAAVPSFLTVPATHPHAASQATVLAGVASHSQVADRFYEEGLRRYYAGDDDGAARLFATALQEDSAFAMAWYYSALATSDGRLRFEHLHRAVRAAEAGSERDRLLIQAAWANHTADPSRLRHAERLVERYPGEVDGHYLLGGARIDDGDFLGAVRSLERGAALDSLGASREEPRCGVCDALGETVRAYVYADSLGAGERTARRWLRLQPESPRAWRQLAWVLWRQERWEEAMEARGNAALHGTEEAEDRVYPSVVAVRAGQFTEADALLRQTLRTSTPTMQREALWWLTFSLRYQGRLREALEAAEQYRDLWLAMENPPFAAAAVPAQVLFEMGRYREAAAMFDSAAVVPFTEHSPVRSLRHSAWVLSHAASAHAAAGDTVRLAMLADTLESLGARSGMRRDRLLHHYARGLLSLARGDSVAAAGSFRASLLSAVEGHVRPKLELARLQVSAGQPEEAVAVLQAALRGPMSGGGHYATRTELHELLGYAHQAAGRPDSAAVHYRHVLRAWTHADPELAGRRGEVEDRLRTVTAVGG